VLFAMHISGDKGKVVEDEEVLRRYSVFEHFLDLIPTKISEFSPNREVEFSIELVLGVVPPSKASYRMRKPKLVNS